MYTHPVFGRTYGVIVFDGADERVSYSPEYFAANSEHISLDTATDGSEVGYVNHTAGFGGTFTGYAS